MNSLPRSIAIFLSILFAFFMVPSQCASAPLSLAGNYKITENTDLGSEVRVTLQINLSNSGTTSLTIIRVGLHSISAPGQLVAASSNLVVHSHSQSQVSLQFLIPKKDFTQWQSGPHQQFLLTYKPTGGKSTLISIPLLRIHS